MYIFGKIQPTTRLLREKIECKAGLFLTKKRRAKFIINWGRIKDFKDSVKVLNRALVTNKHKELALLTSNNVKVPNYTDDIINNHDHMFPVLGRKFHHTQGKDIVKYDTYEEWENRAQEHDYYIQFIQKKGEYRVHVLGDEVKCITKKKRMEGEQCEIVWSHDKGWKQIRYRTDGKYYAELSDIGKRAVSALGYDFGAVDVIIGKDKKLYVLEINSAPGLIENRIEEYINYFKEEEEKWNIG